MFNTNEEYLTFIEEKIKITLPKETTIIQQVYNNKGIHTSTDHNLIKNDSVIKLNSTQLINVFNFKETLADNEKEFIPILFTHSTTDFKYYTIYNLDSNTFFDLDYTSKTNYLCLAYNIKDNVLLTTEFYKK